MRRYIQGIVTCAAIGSLLQDCVFKTADKYAQFILNGGWTDRTVTIPIALLALIVVALTWVKE